MADKHPVLAGLAAWGGSLAICIGAITVSSGWAAGAGTAMPVWLTPSLGIAATIAFLGAARATMTLLRRVETATRTLSTHAHSSPAEAAGDLLSEARSAQGRINNYRLEVERLQDIDPVTGLGNRKWLQIRTGQELSRAGREGTPLSFILISIDSLDEMAERLGFGATEALQLHIADTLKSFVRPYDAVARVSASEFGVLMPGAAAPTTLSIAERLRAAVTATPPLLLADEQPEVLVVAVERQENETMFDEILNRARELHHAGRQGAESP